MPSPPLCFFLLRFYLLCELYPDHSFQNCKRHPAPQCSQLLWPAWHFLFLYYCSVSNIQLINFVIVSVVYCFYFPVECKLPKGWELLFFGACQVLRMVPATWEALKTWSLNELNESLIRAI